MLRGGDKVELLQKQKATNNRNHVQNQSAVCDNNNQIQVLT